LFFDIETTGFSRIQDRIIEVSFILVENDSKNVLVEYSSKVNPEGVPIHPKALQVHNITAESVQNAPLFKDVWADCLSKIAPFISEPNAVITLVAYNGLRFDFVFLYLAVTRAQFVYPEKIHW